MKRHWHRSLKDRTGSAALTRRCYQHRAVPSASRRPKELDVINNMITGSHETVNQMDFTSNTRR
jgi:hypothetical protein